jgi:hypothetical protein
MFAFGVRPVDKGTAVLMWGGDRSRGYCFEIICADFLAEHIWTTVLLKYCAFDHSIRQFFKFPPGEQKMHFWPVNSESVMNRIRPKQPCLRHVNFTSSVVKECCQEWLKTPSRRHNVDRNRTAIGSVFRNVEITVPLPKSGSSTAAIRARLLKRIPLKADHDTFLGP